MLQQRHGALRRGMLDCVWGTGARARRASANAQPGHGAASPGPGGHSPAAHAASAAAGGKAGTQAQPNVDAFQTFRFIPSPRAIFSVMTLFGTFGYALVAGWQLSPLPAGLLPCCLPGALSISPSARSGT